jgi:hypothetical protein
MLDRELRAWTWPTGEAAGTWRLSASVADLVAVPAVGRVVAATSDGGLHGIDPAAPGAPAWSVRVGGLGARLASSAEADLVVALTTEGEAEGRDPRTGELRWRAGGLDHHKRVPPSISPDGAVVAVPLPGNAVAVLDTASGSRLAVFGGARRQLTGLAFDADGALWAGLEDGTIRRWTPPVEGAGWAWASGGGAVVTAAASASGDVVFIGDADSRLVHMDAACGAITGSHELPGRVCHVRASPVPGRWLRS